MDENKNIPILYAERHFKDGKLIRTTYGLETDTKNLRVIVIVH